jgi:hypothetical protein
MIYQYVDESNQHRSAVILSSARKWMRIAVIEAGDIKVMRVPITERDYFTEPDIGERRLRKQNASLKRIARKKGVSGKVREEIKAAILAS